MIRLDKIQLLIMVTVVCHHRNVLLSSYIKTLDDILMSDQSMTLMTGTVLIPYIYIYYHLGFQLHGQEKRDHHRAEFMLWCVSVEV